MNFKIKTIIREKCPILVLAIKACISIVRHQLSRWKIKDLLKKKRVIFIELGAGEKNGEGGWVTIDMSEKCDIFWDLRNGIPFSSERVSKIYSSHLFEHLTFKEAQKLLDECKRVLTPGGTFSICVPNARLYIEAYFKPDSFDENKFLDHKPAYNNTSKIDYINYMAYMDGHHKYMFDEENLVNILKLNGFRNARLRQFNSLMDRKERDFESIYAEAEK